MKLSKTKNIPIILILCLILALITTHVLAATSSWQNIGTPGFSAGQVNRYIIDNDNHFTMEK